MFNLLLARQEAYSYAVKKIGIIDTFRTTDVRVDADLFLFDDDTHAFPVSLPTFESRGIEK